jgi:sodium-dependent phosphate cotransporter
MGLILLLLAFLTGVHGFGEGLTLLGKGALDSFFHATENPSLALVVGILATSIVQSSSVTTSLIVGLTAAPENALPLANAIPMVMGANFGTTVTNSIVSLAHLGRRDEFRRAFAVATCDDFFEILSVASSFRSSSRWHLRQRLGQHRCRSNPAGRCSGKMSRSYP